MPMRKSRCKNPPQDPPQLNKIIPRRICRQIWHSTPKIRRPIQERKKHIKINKYPKIPHLGSHPKNSLYAGSFPGRSRKRDPPPRKEFGLSNLYAGDRFNSLCGHSLCAFLVAPDQYVSHNQRDYRYRL